MMFGFGWKMAMSPTEWTGSFSNTGSHVMPLSRVRKMPPVDEATYMTKGSDSTTSMSTMRPDMVAGPMFLSRRPKRSRDCRATCCAGSRGARVTPRTATKKSRRRFMAAIMRGRAVTSCQDRLAPSVHVHARMDQVGTVGDA
jgi:hypothetical protein